MAVSSAGRVVVVVGAGVVVFGGSFPGFLVPLPGFAAALPPLEPPPPLSPNDRLPYCAMSKLISDIAGEGDVDGCGKGSSGGGGSGGSISTSVSSEAGPLIVRVTEPPSLPTMERMLFPSGLNELVP